jgi:hypothetical protein
LWCSLVRRLLGLLLLQRRLLRQWFLLLLAKVLYCSLQLCLGCSFLLNLLLHDLRSFCHCLSPGQMLLQEAQTFIFLAEARQLILNDCFDFFF